MRFAAPDIEILDFPAWDCQPYDRVSPNAAIAARRMTVLSRLARSRTAIERPRILSTTVNAILQRVPPRDKIAADSFSAAPGNAVDMDGLVQWLEIERLYPRIAPCAIPANMRCAAAFSISLRRRCSSPCGSISSAIRWNRSAPSIPRPSAQSANCARLDLVPMSEVQLTTDSMRRFRQAYVARFGAQTRGDMLYEAVSEGRRHPGLEHWLPLFYEGLDTLVDYTGEAPLFLDAQAEDAATSRLAQIADYYDARKIQHEADPTHSSYKPLPPDALYLTASQWRESLAANGVARITPFAHPEGSPGTQTGLVIDCGGRMGRNFAPERADEGANVFRAAADHIHALQAPASASSSPAGRRARANA